MAEQSGPSQRVISTSGAAGSRSFSPAKNQAAIRSVVGSVTLGLMIALSVTQGRRLFFLCRRLGLLPKPDAPSLSAVAPARGT